MNKIPVIIISGSVGVGKTAVANAMSEIFSSKSISHAVVDMDSLRQAFPRPQNDPFHTSLGYKNLAVIWKNFKKAGVGCLIIPSVIENRSDLEKYHSAIPNAEIFTILLTAKLGTIHNRLKNREIGNTLEWHLNRATELNEQLENKKIEDFIVNTDNKSIKEVAEEIITEAKSRGFLLY